MKNFLFLIAVIVLETITVGLQSALAQSGMDWAGYAPNHFSRLRRHTGGGPLNHFYQNQNNEKAIGVFTEEIQPLSAFEINTDFSHMPNYLNLWYNRGEVFRTDCPALNTPYWRMYRGGILRANIYNPTTGLGNDLVLETWINKSNIIFSTFQIPRMIITDGSGTGNTGFVGIGNYAGTNFMPASLLHLNDGAFDTYAQITNTATGATTTDGLRFGILSTGEAILNQQENASILFNTFGFPRMQIAANGFVGIANYQVLLQPQHHLHLYSDLYEDWLQITTKGTDYTADDGLLLGLNTNNQACLWQQEFASMRFDTRFGTFSMDEGRRMEIIGQSIFVDGTNYDNITRVSISEVGNEPVTIPRSLLHLGMDAPPNGGGWRDWMDVGTYISGGVQDSYDNMYVGLKIRPYNDPPPDKAWTDVADAVIAWGDNDGSNTSEGPDNLRFIFNTPFNGAQTGSGSYDGLEVARITPWGNMGIGAEFTNEFTPKRRLDVHDPGEPASPTSIGRPQLRLSQEIYFNVDPALALLYGTYTDFQTTGTNNSYGASDPTINTAGHLLINPRSNGIPRVVAINMTDDITPTNLNLALDVNGEVNIRHAEEDINEALNQVLMRDENNNGRVMWRNIASISGADGDWYDVATGQPPLLPDIAHDKYTFGNIRINVPVIQLSHFPHMRFAVMQKTGYYFSSNNNYYMSVAGGFLNNYNHQTTPLANSSAYGVYSVATGNGCYASATIKYRNYGGYFLAKNADFNYGIYATVATPSGGNPNDIAGLFNGDLATTSVFVALSDSSLKENIVSLDHALNTISQLKPKLFNFKTTPYLAVPTGNQFGIIAQEAEMILPELVSEITIPEEIDSLGNIINPSQTYKGLNYTGLIPITIRAVQELDSAVTILQQTVPPAKPVLVLPANDAANIPLSVTFSWEPAARATSYTLTVTGGKTKPDYDVIIINTTDTFASVSLSNYCTSYQWSVIAYNQQGSSDISDIWNFYTITPAPPLAPLLDMPADSVIELPLSNTFSWYSSENAEKYYLFITTGSAAGDIMVTQVVTTDTFTVASVPSYSTHYRWWVVAENCGGKSVNSEERAFTTLIPPPPPLPPALALPATGDTITSLSPVFTWYRSEGASGYSFYVSTTPGATGIIYNNSIVDTFAFATGLKDNVTYYWWVTACNPYSCGDISEIWSFYMPPFGTPKTSEPILSDALYKTNESPLTNALSKVLLLNGVYFNWNTATHPELTDTSRQIGFIAQDVEQVIPEVVETDAVGVKYVDYSRVVPVLNEAIKELKNENDSLKSVIATYDGRLTLIEDILASCCTETQTRNSSVNVTIETRPVVVPSQNTVLNQNQPNPFKTFTIFTYTLGESGKCELVIEDTYGRTIATLVSENQQTGNYSVEWEASTQPAGIYFYSLRVNGKVLVKKAIKIE